MLIGYQKKRGISSCVSNATSHLVWLLKIAFPMHIGTRYDDVLIIARINRGFIGG